MHVLSSFEPCDLRKIYFLFVTSSAIRVSEDREVEIFWSQNPKTESENSKQKQNRKIQNRIQTVSRPKLKTETQNQKRKYKIDNRKEKQEHKTVD